MAKECPHCHLANPDTAQCCDCGYDFVERRKHAPAVAGKSAPGSRPPREVATQLQEVAVVDVQMPFGSMVVFMVKWAVAAIPAMLILFLMGLILFALFGGLITGLQKGVGE
jgi:hypothetical protein